MNVIPIKPRGASCRRPYRRVGPGAYSVPGKGLSTAWINSEVILFFRSPDGVIRVVMRVWALRWTALGRILKSCWSAPAASSAALAAQLLGKHTSPTQAAVRAERMLRLQDALNTLDPIDREILSLRHFEELTRSEAAQALGIEEAAAAKRYVRALKRLKDTLAGMPGG